MRQPPILQVRMTCNVVRALSVRTICTLLTWMPAPCVHCCTQNLAHTSFKNHFHTFRPRPVYLTEKSEKQLLGFGHCARMVTALNSTGRKRRCPAQFDPHSEPRQVPSEKEKPGILLLTGVCGSLLAV